MQKEVLFNLKESTAYILIGPSRGRALTGQAHTGALFTATLIVTLKVVESQFAAITILSRYILLQGYKKESEMDDIDKKFMILNCKLYEAYVQCS